MESFRETQLHFKFDKTINYNYVSSNRKSAMCKCLKLRGTKELHQIYPFLAENSDKMELLSQAGL